MSSRPSNPEPAYLDSIIVAITIIVIVEGDINHLLRTGDDLPNGGKAIVVRIRRFYLF
jgi:hypothetical protein